MLTTSISQAGSIPVPICAMLCHVWLWTVNNRLPMMCFWPVQVGEEVKFDPQVMVERLHRQQTFHQAQLEHGDILLVQAVLPEVNVPCCLILCQWPAQIPYKQCHAQTPYQEWTVWTVKCTSHRTPCVNLAQGVHQAQLASGCVCRLVFMLNEHCLCICMHDAVCQVQNIITVCMTLCCNTGLCCAPHGRCMLH